MVINHAATTDLDKTGVVVVDTHICAYQQPNENAQLPNGIAHRTTKSISSFIAGFKSAVNSKIDDYIDKYKLDIPKYNRNNHFFQPNYYDHIIRNDTEYKRIINYIVNNPSKWTEDKLHEQNSR